MSVKSNYTKTIVHQGIQTRNTSVVAELRNTNDDHNCSSVLLQTALLAVFFKWLSTTQKARRRTFLVLIFFGMS